MAVNYKDFVLSQYANSPHFIALIDAFVSSIDSDEDVEKFYEKIFNISTAEEGGLDVWGNILNIPRNVVLSDGGIYHLDDDTYRFILSIRAMSNISNCTLPNLQEIMTSLFQERGNVKVVDTGTMHIKFVFDFLLTQEELAILGIPNIIPRPTGVGIEIVENLVNTTFGFHGTGFQPFGQGNFRSDVSP